MPDLTPTEIVGDALAGWVRSMGGDPGWLRPYGAARVVLDALSAAGRLLPEGGQTEHGWGMRDRTGKVYPARSEQDARELASNYAARGVEVVKQLICTGPWVAVDQEATDG